MMAALGQEPTFGWNQLLPRRGVASGVCVVAISPLAGKAPDCLLAVGVDTEELGHVADRRRLGLDFSAFSGH